MIISNTISAADYMNLRKAVGWSEFPLEEAQAGIDNSIVWCLRDDGDEKPVGVARVIWDHGYVIYIADIIVVPEYQGRGWGRVLMEQVMDFIRQQLKPGYRFMVSLSSAKNKDKFYEKFGFAARPNDDVGPGMYQWITSEE